MGGVANQSFACLGFVGGLCLSASVGKRLAMVGKGKVHSTLSGHTIALILFSIEVFLLMIVLVCWILFEDNLGELHLVPTLESHWQQSESKIIAALATLLAAAMGVQNDCARSDLFSLFFFFFRRYHLTLFIVMALRLEFVINLCC
jgi:hypothetical protein